MNTITSNVAIPVLLSSVTTRTYSFQEITDPSEMEKLFRLRYRVYSESDLAPFLKKNDYQVDMDVYDLHSRFYGIYCKDELIAGVRAVIDRRDYYNPEVFEIGQKYGIYVEDKSNQEKLINSDYADFPFLSYPAVPEEVKQFYEKQRKDKKIYMVSRCAIDAEHRGLKTIQFLTESIAVIISLFCGEKVGLAMSDVSIPHSRFYSRYGYFPIENASTYVVNNVPGVTLAIRLSTNLSLSSFPPFFHSKCEEMGAEFTMTGKIERTIF